MTAVTFTLLVQMIHGGASNLNLKLPKASIQNTILKANFGNQHPLTLNIFLRPDLHLTDHEEFSCDFCFQLKYTLARHF